MACPPHRLSPPTTFTLRRAVPIASVITRSARRSTHVDGVTVEEAEHQIRNPSLSETRRAIHFGPVFGRRKGRFGRRPDLRRACDLARPRASPSTGLPMLFTLLPSTAAGTYRRCFAGSTVFAWSEVPGAGPRCRVGTKSARCGLRTVATKDRSCADFPAQSGRGGRSPPVLLDLDYWVLIASVACCSDEK